MIGKRNNNQSFRRNQYKDGCYDFKSGKTYYILQEIDKNVSGMKKNIGLVCDSLQQANRKLEEIANNTMITTWISTVIATQVTDWKEKAQHTASKIYA